MPSILRISGYRFFFYINDHQPPLTKSTDAVKIWSDDIKLHLSLDDGRELSVPTNWFPSLRDATPEQRDNWRFIGDGEGIHWEDLNEDILVEGLL